MRKRKIRRIVLLVLLAAVVVAGLIVALIKYRDSQIPEQIPVGSSGEQDGTGSVESGTGDGNETETERFDYSKAEKSEGLEYVLNAEGNGYTVIGMGSCTDKNVVLPESYEGKPVTAIGDQAFAGADLESIAFSTVIKSVGKKAFMGHDSLKIYFDGNNVEWLLGVKKDPGWRIDCDFSVIYPTDPNWEIDIT